MTAEEIVADVVARLGRIGIPYAVGGSMASGTWGKMRHTNDADIAVRIAPSDAQALKAAFTDPYYIGESGVEEALSSSGTYRIIQVMQMDEVFKIDLFVLQDGPYERSELERAQSVETSYGVVKFSAPENIVIAKLRWFDLGNRVSDKQWNDIVQVLEIQKGKLDETYLDRWADHFGVRALLDEARSQTFD